MKPYKTLLVLLVFLSLLFGPSFFLEGPVMISPGFSIKFPSIPALITEEQHYVDVPDTLTNTAGIKDTIDRPVDTSQYDLITTFQAIENFDTLFAAANIIDSIRDGSRQFRIMYYGDSQLEGDRITDYLRAGLREISGGTGPGLLSPTMLVPYTRTAVVSSSQNWERFTYLSYKSGELNKAQLGPMLSMSRYIGNGQTGKSGSEAWVRIYPSVSCDSAAAVYDRLRIFYGNLTDTLVLELSSRKEVITSDTLLPVVGISEYTTKLGKPGEVKIKFSGKSSPDIYGISIESDSGVIVDNIPSRGSAGIEFSMIDRQSLSEIYSLLKPDLLILHYGLNVVLNETDNYSYYENAILRQLVFLKKELPDAMILLVGLTDMAKNTGEGYHSFPNITLIRDAQERAARRAGVMFWDSREAMGGEDAIVKWKGNTPQLASDDYTHLSYEGGHVLASCLINSIMNPAPDTISVDSDSLATVNDTAADSAGVNVKTGSIKVSDKIPMTFKDYKNEVIKALKYYNPADPMTFTRFSFWLFFLVLLMGYSLIAGKPLLRNVYLLLFSLFFYYKSGGIFFFLLIISTLSDYFAALVIHRLKTVSWKRLFVFLSLLVNLGMLGYFKYTAFFTNLVNDIFNLNLPVQNWAAMLLNNEFGTSFNISSIVLPVGISFFTFQTISYTMDVYRGRVEPVRNILDFGFYVSFFPQLVAGPIVRASEFIPQLYAKFSLSKREWGHALFLILGGLVKKVIISDYISVNFIDRVFANPAIYSGFENLLSVYGYGLQIYCDFSGYTDIAIGIALMLGYRLPVNFNSPYKAVNISDFWRRWHISLSRWLKDYLYISLGGNRKGRFRTNVNLFITMLLGGLWHGAAWRFVIWGGLHGVGLVIHKLWARITGSNRSTLAGRFISIFITFNFVSFCWIFFRAGSIDAVKAMLHQIYYFFAPGNWIQVLKAYSQVITIIMAGYILHFLPARVKESYRGLFIRVPLVVKLMVAYILALAIYNIQSADIQPFIYFRF